MSNLRLNMLLGADTQPKAAAARNGTGCMPGSANVSHHRMRLVVRFVSSYIVATSTCVSAGAQVCIDDSPSAASVALYKQHYDFIHAGYESAPLSVPLRKLVAANIEQNLKEGDVGAVDWDFWTDAQDGESSPEVKAVLVNRRGAKALVRLQYYFRSAPRSQPHAKLAEVHLLQSGTGCWLVDDLRRNGKSLSSILQRGTH